MSNVSWYDGCCSKVVVVFVSVVSPTTTVCGSFVGAVVVVVGGGGASSVVLQSIVSRGIILFSLSLCPGLFRVRLGQDTFRWMTCGSCNESLKQVRYPGTCTDGRIKSYEYTYMYVMYKTGYRYLTYISSIFRYYRCTVCELFSPMVILKKCHNCSVSLFPCA